MQLLRSSILSMFVLLVMVMVLQAQFEETTQDRVMYRHPLNPGKVAQLAPGSPFARSDYPYRGSPLWATYCAEWASSKLTIREFYPVHSRTLGRCVNVHRCRPYTRRQGCCVPSRGLAQRTEMPSTDPSVGVSVTLPQVSEHCAPAVKNDVAVEFFPEPPMFSLPHTIELPWSDESRAEKHSVSDLDDVWTPQLPNSISVGESAHVEEESTPLAPEPPSISASAPIRHRPPRNTLTNRTSRPPESSRRLALERDVAFPATSVESFP